jgi:hypothetical protein
MQKRKLKMDYSDQEKEWIFARWFWNQGDSSSWAVTKVVVTLIIAILLGITSYITISSIHTTLTAGIVGIGFFLTVALLINTNIRTTLQRFFRRANYEQVEWIEAYHDLGYYFINGHQDILFIENGSNLTGVGLFRLKSIPLMIHGNFERFIRSLYQQQIPLYWTYGQAPIGEGAILSTPAVTERARSRYSRYPSYEVESRLESHGGMWGVRIIFGTRRTVSTSGDIEAKRLVLYKQLSADLFKIHTAFTSAYPHTVLEPLQGKELEKAFSITITGGGLPAFF